MIYTLWKHPKLLPVLTTPAAVISILVGGADLVVPGIVQASAHTPASTLIRVAQFACDAWVPRMEGPLLGAQVPRESHRMPAPPPLVAEVTDNVGDEKNDGDGREDDGGSTTVLLPSTGEEPAVENAPASHCVLADLFNPLIFILPT
ncbi:hypothetical protein EI94DRAFT_1841205 [Lactarius quietus]|nr:hypothetical protein EI94DRAFT_1841205 [Lactarius quietus]